MAKINLVELKRQEILKGIQKELAADAPFKNKELMIALKLNEEKERTIKCCICLSPDHVRRLKLLSIRTGYAQSAIIRTLIDAYFPPNDCL